ncbi:MAG TPA: 5-dehydro-4-deoxyglucarate dehydratase [Trebonia sp.]|jgi:5-dehydro-4-deoxyglucarate dehydratase|nr:5-dehydro-4-deoxyglucarate dehydratase [Trebonia sp.]
MFRGLLFFPVTPYTQAGDVDLDEFAAHVKRGVDAGAGGVFAACGTGEFSALEPGEYSGVVAAAVEAAGGRVPVFAGAGGPVRTARKFSDRAKENGANGILLLPPYLTEATGAGLEAYVRDATREDLPAIVYNRANARFSEDTAVAAAALPQIIGFKDGVGDLDLMGRIVRAVRDSAGDKEFWFFNGMPTAEATQRAYRAIGVPLYSSAAFAFAPSVALAYHAALERGDEDTLTELDRSFYHPLVRLRNKGTGYAVSLIKAGVEITGYSTGGVRAPLSAVLPEHRAELEEIYQAGLKSLAALREAGKVPATGKDA